jgi:short-subunit dehydrogenase involved in D-alanine esterification of teichoic acids
VEAIQVRSGRLLLAVAAMEALAAAQTTALAQVAVGLEFLALLALPLWAARERATHLSSLMARRLVFLLAAMA